MKKLTTSILLVGTPSETPDLLYAGGFAAPDPIVLLVTGNGRHLVVSELEQGRANRLAETQADLHVWTPEQLGLHGVRRRRLSEWALAVLRRFTVTAVTVPGAFPLVVAMRLKQARIKVSVTKDALFPAREVKNAGEIGQITQSQRAAVAAMRVAVKTIGETTIGKRRYLMHRGRRLTAETVQTAIQQELLNHRTMCRDVIVAGGRQATDPHERGRGPLKAGEAIVIDIFPRHLDHGYWGDLTRTVLRGKCPDPLRRQHAAVEAAHAAAVAAVRPRVAGSTIHATASGILRERGFETGVVNGTPRGFIHSTGHGVGLAIHESPSLGGAPGRLKAGQVLTVEPGLYYPDIGGVRIEDTLLVTADGHRILVPLKVPFEL